MTAKAQNEARTAGRRLVASNAPAFSSIDRLVAKTSKANTMEVLFLVFREAIESQNEALAIAQHSLKPFVRLSRR